MGIPEARLNEVLPGLENIVPIKQSSERVGIKVFNGLCAIQGLGYWIPDQITTTREVEDRLLINSGVARIGIEEKTGVRQYRVAGKDDTVVDMSVRAVKNLYNCGLFGELNARIQDVDVLIYCGVTREYLEPATAVVIQKALNIECVNAFDVSNACLGFIDGLCLANALIGSAQASNVLIVGAELGSRCNKLAQQELANGADLESNFASLTLADGAVAALVTAPRGHSGELVVKHGIRQTFGEFSELCVIKSEISPMQTNPSKLFAAALAKLPGITKEVLDASNWKPADIDLLVPHQASAKAIKVGARSLGVSLKNVARTLRDFGNMGSVALPFALAMGLKQSASDAVNKITLFAFGSGLGVSVITLERKSFG